MHHDWRETSFDWEALDKSGDFIEKYSGRARVGVVWKEKWGTLIVVPYYFDGSLSSLIYKGFTVTHNIQAKWIQRDYKYVAPLLNLLFGGIIRYVQGKILKRAFKLAVRKYPHIEKEILAGCTEEYIK